MLNEEEWKKVKGGARVVIKGGGSGDMIEEEDLTSTAEGR